MKTIEITGSKEMIQETLEWLRKNMGSIELSRYSIIIKENKDKPFTLKAKE